MATSRFLMRVLLLGACLLPASGRATEAFTWKRLGGAVDAGDFHYRAAAPLGGGVSLVLGERRGARSWDGSAWKALSPLHGPSQRVFPGLVGSGDGRVLLFGGAVAEEPQGDLWEWKGDDWRELPRAAAASWPSPRLAPAMAWMEGGKVLLFGGVDDGEKTLSDLWEWDGVVWTQKLPVGAAPRARGAGSLVPLGGGRALLFGGFETGKVSSALGDTWVWDGKAWRALTFPVGTPTPPARGAQAMAALEPGKVLLYGGTGETDYQDTWLWTGEAWRELSQANRTPPSRICGTLVPEGGGKAWLLGSDKAGEDETPWEWDGARWIEGHPATWGFPQVTPGFVWVARKEGSATLVGGRRPGARSETWEWTPDGWSERASSDGAARPSPRVGAAAAALDGRMVLFGGGNRALEENETTLFSDTWEWDGTLWRSMVGEPGANHPSARLASAMASLDGGQVLLFGGSRETESFDDTWSWNGQSWREIGLKGKRPSPRSAHAMAPLGGGKVLLFGGKSNDDRPLSDTWLWDGTRWTKQKTGKSGPGGRYFHSMIPLGEGRVLLFGGQEIQEARPFPWLWEKGRWSQVAIGKDAPPVSVFQAMVPTGSGGLLYVPKSRELWEIR